MDASEYDLQMTNAYSSSNHHITCVYIYILKLDNLNALPVQSQVVL